MVDKEENKGNYRKRKIILMGLDNAGKTSIVLSLKGDKNLLSFCKLSPTKDHDIVNMEFQDTDFNIWDFGGQKTYRDKHIINFPKYFKGCNKLIYVIDIQDINRYDMALDYLKTITNKVENHKNDFAFSIFLHKFDPKLQKNHPDITEGLINELVDKINEIVGDEYDIEIFKTTIYTQFEKSPF
jgi:GTPase SAR1 family protein